MAEIKSTMEIIMEKLSKIGISEKDKQEIMRREAEDLAKRLMIQYMEERSISCILDELDSKEAEKREMVRDSLIEECIRTLSPYNRHNKDILALLEKLTGKGVGPIKDMISSIEEELNKERAKIRQKIIQALESRGISGSAVVPNVEADREWKEKVEEAKDKIHSDVNNLISQLK